MDRDPRKQLDEYRLEQAGPIENSLIDDLLSGEASRGEFLRRATVLGLSTTAIGAALGTAGFAAPAFAAPKAVKAGGRLRLGIIPGPTGDLEPHLFADHGRLATGTHLRRVPHAVEAGPDARARARRELEVECDGHAVGVQPAQGRQVPGRLAVHGRRRRDDVQPPHGSEQRLGRALGVQGRPQAGRHQDGSATTIVVFYLDAPTASFPYLTSNTTYQAIILPTIVQARDRSRRRGRRPVRSPRLVHAGRRRQVRPEHRLVGRERAARRRRRDLLHRQRGGHGGASRRPDRPDQPGLVLGQPRAVQQPERPDPRDQGHARIARSRCSPQTVAASSRAEEADASGRHSH